MRFNEILLLGTLLTGLIWLLDSLFFRPKRIMRILPGKKGEDTQEPWWVEYSRSFFPILLVVLILRAFILEPFRIPSGSMRPTLLEGDFILVNKFDYGLRVPLLTNAVIPLGEPKRGDVVVFKHVKNGESIDMIKRVIGLPGDHIQYKDKMIYVNGVPVKLEFIEEKLDKDVNANMGWMVRHQKETLDNTISHDIYVHADPNMSRTHEYEDVTVPANHYFMMGDNRDNSDDSRSWGFVSDKDILGKAITIWFSWDSNPKGIVDCFHNCIRWNRIGNHLSEKLEATNVDRNKTEATKVDTNKVEASPTSPAPTPKPRDKEPQKKS